MTIVQRAPEIPGRNRAVRPPLLTMFHQFFWRRQFPSAKSFGEAFTYSIIIDRPDIRPAKIEEKQYLDEIGARLTQVRGYSRWTVELLLLFRVGRHDVVAVGVFCRWKGFRQTFCRRILVTP